MSLIADAIAAALVFENSSSVLATASVVEVALSIRDPAAAVAILEAISSEVFIITERDTAGSIAISSGDSKTFDEMFSPLDLCSAAVVPTASSIAESPIASSNLTSLAMTACRSLLFFKSACTSATPAFGSDSSTDVAGATTAERSTPAAAKPRDKLHRKAAGGHEIK